MRGGDDECLFERGAAFTNLVERHGAEDFHALVDGDLGNFQRAAAGYVQKRGQLNLRQKWAARTLPASF